MLFGERLAAYQDRVPAHDEDAIIELAWSDDVPFESITVQYGLTEAQVIELMRKRLKRSSFRLWRKRVSSSRGNPAFPFFSEVSADLELRASWRTLVEEDLPAAAEGRDWPVKLDHCFARIFLDVSCNRPWRELIPAPAWRNAPPELLERALALGEAVLAGEADLADLNRRSLAMRASRVSPGPGRG